MCFRRNGYPILFTCQANQKEVWCESDVHCSRLVQPYCIIYRNGRFRLVGLAIELFDPENYETVDTQFWGAEGLVDPVALFRAVMILGALRELRSNSLCSAWFAAKGQNGCVTPGDVPHLVSCLGAEHYSRILALYPRRLNEVLDKLWRYRIDVDTNALQGLVGDSRIMPSQQLERLGVIPNLAAV